MKTKRRAYLLYHRRAGKDICCWNFTIRRALEKVGVYYYVLPKYAQGKKVIWDGINEAGERIIDYVPAACIDGKPNSSEMKIKLLNGSIIQIVGSLDFDSLRGVNAAGVVFSEYAQQDPRVWSEVFEPILEKNKGWAVFNTTPMGKNHAYDLWIMSERDPEWHCQKLTVDDTQLITKEQIQKLRDHGRSEDVIQQEYYCSFERGVDGSFYSRQMHLARQDDRICRVPLVHHAKVCTYWDIGVGDATAIWLAQHIGTSVYLIGYYENQGEGVSHYIRYLDEYRQRTGCVYGEHYAPHDIKVREFTSGISRLETCQALGFKMQITPDLPFEDGVDAVREVLPRCFFDAKNCEKGIKCLDNYRKKWNEVLAVYSTTPVHDYASHGADAFRYLCVNVRAGQTASGRTPEEWKKMRNQNTWPT